MLAVRQAAEDAKVGAIQKAFSWRELSVLLSGYEYAAIMLVDSRYLYPTYSMPPLTRALTPPETDDGASDCSEANEGDGPPSAESGGHRARDVSKVGFAHRQRDRASLASDEDKGRRFRRRKVKPGTRRDGGTLEQDPEDDHKSSNGATNSERSGREEPTLRSSSACLSLDPSSSPKPPPQHQSDAPDKIPERGRGSEGPSRPLSPWTSRDASSDRSTLGHDERSRGSSPAMSPATSCEQRKRTANLVSRRMLPADATEPPGSNPKPASRSRAPLSPLPAENRAPQRPAPALSSPRPTKKMSLSPPSSPHGSSRHVSVGTPSPGSAPFGPSLRTPSPPSSPSPASSYCGHYILLVGWSEAERVFIARDPSLPSSPSDGSGAQGGPDAQVGICLSPEALDRARRSFGTDEDILVIDLARSRKGGVAAGPLAAAAAATALAASAASSAAAASALVGLLAMAAAAAASSEASGFSTWGWPDPVAWFGGGGASTTPASGTGASGANDENGAGNSRRREGEDGDGKGFPEGMAEAAARRFASLLSLAASGLKFPTVGDGGAESAARRLASLVSLAASGLRFPTVVGDGYRSSRDAREGAAESAAKKLASLLSLAASGLRFPSVGDGYRYPWESRAGGEATVVDGDGERWAQRVASALEGLLEGGKRAAYSLRDSLADVADAPGGAGAECGGGMAWGVNGEACACCADPSGNLAPCNPGVIVSSA